MIDHNQETQLTATEMVGRTDLLKMVENAILQAKENSSALYFFGAAGMGKTRLLEEIGKMAHQQNSFFWSNIVDLHHSKRQSQIGIEKFIAAELDPHDKYFQPFWNASKEMETERGIGVKGDTVSAARKKVTETFITCYTRMSNNMPVVLTFDTVELLQQELDKAQTVCDINAPDASATQWFKNVLPELQNTVAIFAGRPANKAQWLATLNGAFGKNRVKNKKIIPLNSTETKEFIRALAKKHPELNEQIDDDLCAEIHLVTNGRPIYISLLTELLAMDATVEIATLLPIGAFNKDKPEIHAQAGRQITAHLTKTLPPKYDKQMLVFHFMAFAHQGLDVELLDYLTDHTWPITEIEQLLETIRSYTFIKHHPEDKGILFYHDELYDLFDRYYGRQDHSIGRNLFGRIHDYYQEKYDRLDAQIKEPHPIRTKKDIKKRQALVKQREEISISLLYYKLHIAPHEAYYQQYWWWGLTAIHTNNLDYDMRLRDIVLRFIARYLEKGKSPAYNAVLAKELDVNAIHRDCAVRWVRRLIAQNRNAEARKAASKARKSNDVGFQWDNIDDPLYKADLLSAWGESTYYAPTEKTFRMLQEARELIENLLNDNTLEQNELQRYQRILARIYNALGYAFRVKNQMTTAYSYYQKALYLYQQTNVMAGMTITMVNLAYVYALLGAFDEARVLIEKSIEIREQLGDIYGVVISLNTYALIKLEEDMPINAISLNDQALALIGQHGWEESRAYFLVHQARGRILRKQANLVHRRIYTNAQAEKLYERAREALAIIENSFKKQRIKSKDRLAFDTALEQGRLYRDLMQFSRSTGEKETVIQERFRLSRDYYRDAIEMAVDSEMPDEEANIWEDMAVLYREDGQLEKAWECLGKANEKIGAEYKPKKGEGFVEIPHPVTQSWFTLGKMYLTESKLLKAEAERLNRSDMIEEQFLEQMRTQLLAAACFEQASPFPSDLLRGMRSTRIALYDHISLYGTIPHVMGSIDVLYAEYGLTEKMRRIRTYVEATLGALHLSEI